MNDKKDTPEDPKDPDRIAVPMHDAISLDRLLATETDVDQLMADVVANTKPPRRRGKSPRYKSRKLHSVPRPADPKTPDAD